MHEEKTFKVTGQVMVPAVGTVYVQAESIEEAKRKAMQSVDKEDMSDWGSRLWIYGEWTRKILWTEAEGLHITEVNEEDKWITKTSTMTQKSI